MAKILNFTRSRTTSLLEKGETTLISTCRMLDSVFDGWVEITVEKPDLNITKVRGEIFRDQFGDYLDLGPHLEKVINVRVGPGMLKILKGLMGEEPRMLQPRYMLEECCHGVILGLTKDMIAMAPRDPEDGREIFKDMVKKNTRLYGRCAAFAKGSSLVEGIESDS